MMTDAQRQVASFVFAVLIVGSSVLGFVAIGADVARADIGQQGCLDDAGAFVLSPLVVTYSNWQDACWKADTEAEIDAQMDLNQTYDEALRVADVRANEERLIDSLLTTKQFAKTPVRDEAELVFAQEYVNGSTETEAITASRNIVDSEYDERHKSLAGKYNRDVRNARDTYTQLDNQGAPELLHVYVNGNEVVPTDGNGVTFSVPTSLNDSGNGTAYTISGETVYVATVTVDGTAYTFEDNLGVAIEDPAGELDQVPIVGYDYLVANDPIVPKYTESDADIVVDGSVSDPANDSVVTHNNLQTAIADAVEGDVLYVRDGTYSVNIERESTGMTIVGESRDGVIIDNNADFNNMFEVDGGPTDTPVQIRDVSLQIYGSSYLFGYYSGGSSPEAPAKIQNVELESGAFLNGGNDRSFVIKDLEITGGGEYSYNSGDQSVTDYVGSYYGGRFPSFSDEMIAEQEADRTEILTAFGDSSSGYFSDVWAQLETGVLSITDILNYNQMFSQSFSEEDVGSIAYIDGQYMQAGMSSHSGNYTVVVEAQTGSTVYANAQRSQSATVSTPIEYRGHMWTMNPPASGTWEANTTYDTETLGSPVFVTYYKTTTQMVDGNLVTSTEPATVAIEGEFRITELVAEDGSSTPSIDHSGTPSADPYDASAYADDIENLNARLADLQQQLEDFSNDGGAGGDGGDGTSVCGIELPLVGCTGVTNMTVSLIALAVLGLAGAYVLGPALRGLGGLLDR